MKVQSPSTKSLGEQYLIPAIPSRSELFSSSSNSQTLSSLRFLPTLETTYSAMSTTFEETTAAREPSVVSPSTSTWTNRFSYSAFFVFLSLIVLGPAVVPAWLPMRTHLIAGGTTVIFFYNLTVEDDYKLDPTTGTIIGVAALWDQLSSLLISETTAETAEKKLDTGSSKLDFLLQQAKFLAIAFFLRDAYTLFTASSSPLTIRLLQTTILNIPDLLSNSYILPLIAVPLEFCQQTETTPSLPSISFPSFWSKVAFSFKATRTIQLLRTGRKMNWENSVTKFVAKSMVAAAEEIIEEASSRFLLVGAHFSRTDIRTSRRTRLRF
ncbi:hypothetical protein BJ508DRAFT_179767 [Ascobolus immersus RN42]|uniref:Uncharacterized protein n=1 Tax=Ascobolus immersus RN42 TaxID=1160509 RepID=A0A3N4HUY0_ASCIM|nr:hypothetical protein BJ508DRAFT_179767 [Ascobolus immersus RN42]